MAAAWQASGTLLGSTGADITPVIPTHAVGDILICMAASRVVTETCTTPPGDGGWAVLAGPTNNTGWRVYVFWIRAVSSSMTNPVLDWSAAVGEKYGQVHTIRGAIATGSPFAASALTVDLTDPIVATGVSTTLAGQLVVSIGIGSDNASASVTVTATDPTPLTQRAYSTITTGADAAGSFHEAIRTTAGASGNVTHDHNSTMPAMGVLVAAIISAPTSTAVARISLASGNTPDTRTDHEIKVRARTTAGAGTINAALYEGASNRSGDLESSALTTSLADYTLPIADADAEDITNYSDLEIRLWGHSALGGAIVYEVAELSLSAPEGAAPSFVPRHSAHDFGSP